MTKPAKISTVLTNYLNQLKYIGLFFSAEKKNNLNEYLDRDIQARVGFIKSLFEVLESYNMKFTPPEKIPFIYSQDYWNYNYDIAGYYGADSDIKISEIIDSYVIHWFYQTDYSISYNTKYWRNLKAALWIYKNHGISKAIKYLVDLHNAGFIVDYEVTRFSIQFLVKTHCLNIEIEKALELHFGNVPLTNSKEWVNVRLKPVQFDSLPMNEKRLYECVEILVKVAIKQINEIKNSKCYDEYFLNSWKSLGVLKSVVLVCGHMDKNPPPTIKPILEYIEEVSCDLGVFVNKIKRDNVPFTQKLNIFLPFMEVIKSQSPNDWKKRVIENRAFVPLKIKDVFFNNQFNKLPDDWSRLSHKLVFPFCYFVLKGNYYKFYRTNPLPLFTAIEISNLFHNVIRKPISNEMSFLLEKRLKLEHGNTAIDRTNQNLYNDKINEYRYQLEIATYIKEYKQSCEMGDKFMASGKIHEQIECLQKFQNSYPYCESISYEVAVANDKSMNYEDAFASIEKCLILSKPDSNTWNSCRIILKHIEDFKSMKIAEVGMLMIKEKELKQK